MADLENIGKRLKDLREQKEMTMDMVVEDMNRTVWKMRLKAHG